MKYEKEQDLYRALWHDLLSRIAEVMEQRDKLKRERDEARKSATERLDRLVQAESTWDVEDLLMQIATLRESRAQFERDLVAQMDREYAEKIAALRGAGRVWEERAKALAESIATLRNRAEDAEAVALALNARVEKLVEISP